MEHKQMGRVQIKTASKIIQGKVDNWISSIDDELLQAKLKVGVMVSGGCITSLLIGEKVNDFDIYFNSKQLTIDVCNYYVKKFNDTNYMEDSDKVTIPQVKVDDDGLVSIYIRSKGYASENNEDTASLQYEYFEQMEEQAAKDYIEKDIGHALDKEKRSTGAKYRPVYLSTNAITLSDKIQLITRFYGSPEDVHKNFDFVHAMCYWTRDKGCVVSIEAMDCMNSKVLKYNGSLFPLCSQFRIAKFVARGWKINAGQQFKIQKQISELDLNSIKVLRSQLSGVDTAYFNDVLTKLEDAGIDKVDNTYLMTLIDKMFG